MVNKFFWTTPEQGEILEGNFYNVSLADKRKEFLIYTDGSLVNEKFKDKKKTKQGFGWFILNDKVELAEFCASAQGFSSSTRMELLAIITAIRILPKGGKVIIYTDSANDCDATFL